MVTRETARYWRHPALPEVDLLRARYVTHRYAKHTHDAYAIALIRSGVEEWWYAGTTARAGVGGVGLVNPDTVHTGQAGVPEGWAYRVLYLPVPTMRAVADELGAPPGTPWFPEPVADNPAVADAVLAAHRAAETGDALAASSLTEALIVRLLTGYAGRRPSGPATPPGARVADRAREILDARLTDPPSLQRLATQLDTGPFALLRAFRARHGLPPHTYLTQARVRAARGLLDAGTPPAEVAVRVGFVDQAHLSRHFRRIVGVPPGAYQRERRIVQERSGRLRLA